MKLTETDMTTRVLWMISVTSLEIEGFRSRT